MNIFESYLKEILSLIKQNQNKLNLNEINNFKGVNLEIPPVNFNEDLSSNICMVLAKINKLNPNELATKVQSLIKANIKDFKDVKIAGPGFINIDLSNDALVKIINKIFKDSSYFGSFNSNFKFNIEFVSANPTGPMHVGHCRGAIFGDVLSNLLKFNGNKVTKEYYINDYGNQIKNFVESVYLRIIEIKYKKEFPKKENLYPGLYIKDIALKIINDFSNLDFNHFEKNFEFLKKEALKESMQLIKQDLNLCISHGV